MLTLLSSNSYDYKSKRIFHNDCMTQLWKKIKSAREAKKLTQQQLADACSPPVSRAAVAQWEAPPSEEKKPTKPKYENLVTISKMTGKPLDWFLAANNELLEGEAVVNEKNNRYSLRETEKDLTEVALGNSIQIPNIRFETAEIEIILSSQNQQGVELMNISSAEAPIEKWGPNTFGIRVNSLTYSALAAPGNTIIFDPDRNPDADDYVLASFVTDPDSDYEIMQYKKTGGTFELKTAREDIPIKMYSLDECGIHAVMVYVNFGGKSYL